MSAARNPRRQWGMLARDAREAGNAAAFASPEPEPETARALLTLLERGELETPAPEPDATLRAFLASCYGVAPARAAERYVRLWEASYREAYARRLRWIIEYRATQLAGRDDV